MPDITANKLLEPGDAFLVNTSTIHLEDWQEAIFVRWKDREENIGIGSYWYERAGDEDVYIQFEFPVLGFDHDERVRRIEE